MLHLSQLTQDQLIWVILQATVDNFTIDWYNNVQYHTPADLLPFGITAKIAYAPDLDDTSNQAITQVL